MNRRNACLLLAPLLAGTVLLPATAQATGSKLRFGEEAYVPRDHAVAHTELQTWPGSGNEPEGGPYVVYLVRGTQPLHFGYLPSHAIQVGELNIGTLLASDSTRHTA